MTIDRDTLLTDEALWLPDSNVLTSTQMGQINELIISSVGDDASNYPEVLCKALRAIATANMGKASAASGGLKREKIGDEEQEWFSPTQVKNVWKNYINSLTDICPLFGYTGLKKSFGVKITPGAAPNVNPCCDDYSTEF